MAKTVEHDFSASLRHLRNDARLGSFIVAHGPIVHRRAHSRDTFHALAEAIIYQQLSGKAAATILARFIALYPRKQFPTPQDVLATPPSLLRSAGLSTQKAAYIRDLALRCTDGTINPKRFQRMNDEEIIAHVCTVKGIGLWTAQMFLMFTLGRPDVLPVGDLGIQKGFKKLFKLKQLPTPAQMQKLAAPWAGHRTLACMYLWRFVDGGGVE